MKPHYCLGWVELNRGPLGPKESALPLSYGSSPGSFSFIWPFNLQKLQLQLQQLFLVGNFVAIAIANETVVDNLLQLQYFYRRENLA